MRARFGFAFSLVAALSTAPALAASLAGGGGFPPPVNPCALPNAMTTDYECVLQYCASHVEQPLLCVNAKLDYMKAQQDQFAGHVQFKTIDGKPAMVITGLNVYIQSGSGSTYEGNIAQPTGLGNLIIGYNERRYSSEGPNIRTGSHNLIVGSGNNYSRNGSIVAGINNASYSSASMVIGGAGNTVDSEPYTSDAFDGAIFGGWNNTLTPGSDHSVIFGGQYNKVNNQFSYLFGGYQTSTSSQFMSVFGGANSSVDSGDNQYGTALGVSNRSVILQKAPGNSAVLVGP